MNAIGYLIRKEIKNRILDLFHHPAKLLGYLSVIALIAFSAISQMENNKLPTDTYTDIRILNGIYFALLLFIGVVSFLSALKSGTTFFKMSDVNFLFVSPISSKKILAYGLVKQMASSLFMMLFFLLYTGMLRNIFGVTIGQVVALVGGVALAVFAVQLLSLLLYSFSAGHPRRTLLFKGVLYVMLGILAALIFVSFSVNGGNKEALLNAIVSPYLEIFPVFGWIKGMVFGIINGNIPRIAVYAILNILTIILCVVVFTHSDSDYYEDVLQSTEQTYAVRQSIKENRFGGVALGSNQKTKVKDTGIHRGWGADVFFYKHIREAKRRGVSLYLRTSTLVLLAVNILLILFFQKMSASEGDQLAAGHLMAIALAFSCYLLFFLNASGDWTRELMRPYIYLVPENSFKKLLWASLTTILAPCIDGIILFAVLGVILRAKPLTVLLCMMIYASMGLLFTAANILSQRVFGGVYNKGLMLLLYFLMIGLLLAPGVAGSAAVYLLLRNAPGILIGLPVAMWNVLISLGLVYACRNILNTAELNT